MTRSLSRELGKAPDEDLAPSLTAQPETDGWSWAGVCELLTWLMSTPQRTLVQRNWGPNARMCLLGSGQGPTVHYLAGGSKLGAEVTPAQMKQKLAVLPSPPQMSKSTHQCWGVLEVGISGLHAPASGDLSAGESKEKQSVSWPLCSWAPGSSAPPSSGQ